MVDFRGYVDMHKSIPHGGFKPRATFSGEGNEIGGGGAGPQSTLEHPGPLRIDHPVIQRLHHSGDNGGVDRCQGQESPKSNFENNKKLNQFGFDMSHVLKFISILSSQNVTNKQQTPKY